MTMKKKVIITKIGKICTVVLYSTVNRDETLQQSCTTPIHNNVAVLLQPPDEDKDKDKEDHRQ